MNNRHKSGTPKAIYWAIVFFAMVTVCACVLIVVTLLGGQTAAPRATVQTTVQTQPATEPEETAGETTQPAEETEPEETTQPTEETEPEETTQVTEETVEETTEEPTEATTQPTTQATIPQAQLPQTMESLLSAAGITRNALENLGCRQLITVTAQGNVAKIRYFAVTDGNWTEYPELTCSGYVGLNGISTTKKEGDGCSPAGLYAVGTAFYIYSQPNTGLDSFRITQDTYWVDDPDSKYYNQRVEGTADKDWDSAEHMIGYWQYIYGFVVNYNMEAVYNAGSAIFFHVGNSSTAGCIATTEQMVLAYLAKLDKTQNPYILMIP